MQKKIIALAIAGLASTAAFAQSNVTIYGTVDYGFMARGGDSGGVAETHTKSEFGAGLSAGSRIGFKGVEDLGNGLKAVFELEYGIANDQVTGVRGSTATDNKGSSAATWSNRHSYVGLAGSFGTVVGGRVDGARYSLFNTYDPFNGGTVGNFTQMTVQVDRADNAIAYISPNFAGFSLLLAHASNILGNEGSLDTSAERGTNGDSRLYTSMLSYDNGPISAKIDYETIKTQGLEPRLWVGAVGASYNFGVVKVSGLYDILDTNDGAKQKSWLLGVSAPVGKATLRASYGQTKWEVDGESDTKASKWALGATYALSKRTNLYADVSGIVNKDDAAWQISPAANAITALSPLSATQIANSQNNGYGTRGFDIGIRHNF